MVGSANGRSMIASTSRLPEKSSRTSTQAISRPKTMLRTVTAAEIVSVTRKDSTAACEVTASQNACQPPPAACQTMAASGSSTITESHTVATPTRSDVVRGRPEWPVSEGPVGVSALSSGRIASGSGVIAVVIRWPACRSS